MGFHIIAEPVAVTLNGEGRGVFHMLEQSVEYIPDLVNELIQIVVERTIVGRDDRQLRIVFEEHETGEMHDPELVERSPDRVLLRRERLNLPNTLAQGFEVLPRSNRHDQGKRVLNSLMCGSIRLLLRLVRRFVLNSLFMPEMEWSH